MLVIALRDKDYGWVVKPSKKVVLVNPKELEEKINILGMVSKWRDTGHSEWEFLLAGWFVTAVIDAINVNNSEADITVLFNRDLLASHNRVFTKEQIFNHIIDSFDVVEENECELRLRFKIPA